MATLLWRKRFRKLLGAGARACRAETRLDPCRVETPCAGAADSRRRRGQRGSILLIVTLATPLVLVPMIGLAIDATILRIVQAKLSAAVDGAALGAGRLLGTTANAQEIAGEFLAANFQTGTPGLWGAYNVTPTITVTLGVTKTVAINATANVPLLFSRIFGVTNSLISAAGTATRRDSRVVLIIDRSGSMNTSDGAGSTVIADLISYAQGFTEKFTEGVDEVGLVVYDGSAVVGYPTIRPWDPTTTKTSTGGPDTSFYSGATTDMVHQIQAIQAGGNTGMAEGLWLAYIELQKAHLKDLVTGGGIDNRQSSIVLFTDGVPTATTVHLNNPADPTPGSPGSPTSIKSTSTCTYKANDAQKMIGWVGLPGPPFTGSITGLYGLANSDATHTANWWMQYAANDTNNPSPSTPEAACSDISGSNFASSSKTDLSQVPNIDGWGNSMDGTAYSNSYFVDSTGHISSPFTGSLDHTKKTTVADWALATWNGVDNTANNIRNDTNLASRTGDTQNMAITIYTIGYLGNGGVDQGLLERVANDKRSSSYNSNQSTGVYVAASDSNALANAFAVIASSILRLSQ